MNLDLVAHITDLLEQDDIYPVTVSVDGFSGSGKTRLGEALSRHFHAQGFETLLLEVELWAHGWSGLTDAVERVRSLVARLQVGPTSTQVWNWWTETLEDPIVLEPKPLILLIGSGSGQINTHVSVWLDADEDVRQSRVAARDPYDWSEHWDEWAEQEKALLAVYDARKYAQFRCDASGAEQAAADSLGTEL